MEITPRPEQKTWTDLIEQIPLNESMNCDSSCVSAVRGAIYRIKLRSNSDFTTKKIKTDQGPVLKVTRIR